MTEWRDASGMPEAARIAHVGRAITTQRSALVGVFVDDDATADRYVEVLTRDYPIVLVDRRPFPNAAATVVLLRFRHAEASA
jgi:hypothetical protein